MTDHNNYHYVYGDGYSSNADLWATLLVQHQPSEPFYHTPYLGEPR